MIDSPVPQLFILCGVHKHFYLDKFSFHFGHFFIVVLLKKSQPSIFFKITIIVCAWVFYLHYVCVAHACSAYRDTKIPDALELHKVVSHHVGAVYQIPSPLEEMSVVPSHLFSDLVMMGENLVPLCINTQLSHRLAAAPKTFKKVEKFSISHLDVHFTV